MKANPLSILTVLGHALTSRLERLGLAARFAFSVFGVLGVVFFTLQSHHSRIIFFWRSLAFDCDCLRPLCWYGFGRSRL